MSVSNPMFPNVVKTQPCENCGYELPQELGQDSKTCKQWAADTVKKLPANARSLGNIIDLVLFTRDCEITTLLKRGPQAGSFGAQSTVTLTPEKKSG